MYWLYTSPSEKYVEHEHYKFPLLYLHAPRRRAKRIHMSCILCLKVLFPEINLYVHELQDMKAECCRLLSALPVSLQ